MYKCQGRGREDGAQVQRPGETRIKCPDRFYANARLDGDDTVVLSSPLVSVPVEAKYNWADYPGGNLYGESGLPVAPFAKKVK